MRLIAHSPAERIALFATYFEPGEHALSILLCSSRRSARQWTAVNFGMSLFPTLGAATMVGARALNKWEIYYLCLTNRRLFSMALSGFLEPLPNGVWAAPRESVTFLGITNWFLLNSMLHLRVNGADYHYHVSWWRKGLLEPFKALGAPSSIGLR